MASRVITGWAIATRLRRVRPMPMMPVATITAQPKCSEGIAAY